MPKSVDSEVTDTTVSEETSGTYELGYHLSSFLSPEEMASAAHKIQELIGKLGGTISAEEPPKLHTLAYTIEYVHEGKKEKIDTAYFGFMRFSALPEKIPTLETDLRLLPRLARFLLVDLPPAALSIPRRYGSEGNGQPKGDKGPEAKESPSLATISSAELDKTIDELVV